MLRLSPDPIRSEWSGGRDGHSDSFEDETWVFENSWTFRRDLFLSYDTDFDVLIELKVSGRGSRKARYWLEPHPKLTPEQATVYLRMGSGYLSRLQLVAQTRCKTLREAKTWASSQDFSGPLKGILRQRFSEHIDVEMFVEGEGWVHWLCNFDMHSEGFWPVGRYRVLHKEHPAIYVQRGYTGWSSTSWPSAWERIASDRELVLPG